MSVENYLESIRKNTKTSSNHTSELNTTMKNLLNYEALKRAVSAGVAKGNKDQFKRLEELSKKILMTTDATAGELKEINVLLKAFYASIPKNSTGSAEVSAGSWVKALKEILDEFGDKLPDKFRNRVRNDLVSTAAAAGADPNAVFQQLNAQQVNLQQITINQTNILENIYEFMEDREKKLERKAEAEKPIKDENERNTKNFWATKMGGVLDKLGALVKNASKVGMFLGLIYVGLGVWNSLSKDIQQLVRGVTSTFTVVQLGNVISRTVSALFRNAPMLGNIAGKVSSFRAGLKAPKLPDFSSGGKASWISQIEGFFARIKALSTHALKEAVPAINKVLRELFPMAAKVVDWIRNMGKTAFGIYEKTASFFKPIGAGISKVLAWFKGLGPILKIAGGALRGLGKFIPGIGWIIQAVISVADFIEGFQKTSGGPIDKIKGGLKRMAVEFIAVFADVASFLLNKFADFLGAILIKDGKVADGAVQQKLQQIVVGALTPIRDVANGIQDWASSKRTGAGYEGGTASTSSSGSYSDLFTAKSQVPSSYGSAMPEFRGDGKINMSAGVKMSDHSQDFYRRAGLSNKVTSGMEGKHAGTASNPRSHYSGNKFDLDISTRSVTAFADEVRKMLKMPDLIEIRTESVPSSIVEGARKILAKEGLPVKKLINDGYPSYSTGPHLDVLIAPPGSKTTTAALPKLPAGASVTTAESIPGLPEHLQGENNPMTVAIKAEMAKIQQEQSKLLSEIKAPNQLDKKKEAAKPTTQSSAQKQSTTAPLPAKKNDVYDASLALLQSTLGA